MSFCVYMCGAKKFNDEPKSPKAENKPILFPGDGAAMQNHTDEAKLNHCPHRLIHDPTAIKMYKIKTIIHENSSGKKVYWYYDVWTSTFLLWHFILRADSTIWQLIKY